MAKRLPRGLRNNNPLNIRVGIDWRGEMSPNAMDADQRAEKAFEVFEDMPHGIRAAAILLQNYQRLHGLKTLRGIILRWAPPAENDTNAYLEAICDRTGLGPDGPVDMTDYHTVFPVIRAMAVHENGMDGLTDADINRGLALAGVEIDNTPIAKTAAVKGSQIAGTAATLGVVGEVIKETAPAMPLIQTALQFAPYLVALLVFAGLGYILIERFTDRQKGYR